MATLAFDVPLTRVEPPSKLVAEATGELQGTGVARWAAVGAALAALAVLGWRRRSAAASARRNPAFAGHRDRARSARRPTAP